MSQVASLLPRGTRAFQARTKKATHLTEIRIHRVCGPTGDGIYTIPSINSARFTSGIPSHRRRNSAVDKASPSINGGLDIETVNAIARTPFGGYPERFGAGDRNRTCDPLITNQMLYLLSYTGRTPTTSCAALLRRVRLPHIRFYNATDHPAIFSDIPQHSAPVHPFAQRKLSAARQ